MADSLGDQTIMDSWTRERHELRANLATLSEDLAELYAYGVDLLGKPPTRTRLTMLAHTIREIVNCSADILLTEGQELPQRSELDQACSALEEVWVSEVGSGTEGGPPGNDPESPDEPEALVTIPRKIHAAVARVVAANMAATGSARRRYAAVATGRVADVNHPATLLIREAIQFFRSFFHLTRGEKSLPLPSEEDVQRYFNSIEHVLRTRTASFFETVDELEDLLREANAQRRDEAEEAP